MAAHVTPENTLASELKVKIRTARKNEGESYFLQKHSDPGHFRRSDFTLESTEVIIMRR